MHCIKECSYFMIFVSIECLLTVIQMVFFDIVGLRWSNFYRLHSILSLQFWNFLCIQPRVSSAPCKGPFLSDSRISPSIISLCKGRSDLFVFENSIWTYLRVSKSQDGTSAFGSYSMSIFRERLALPAPLGSHHLLVPFRMVAVRFHLCKKSLSGWQHCL